MFLGLFLFSQVIVQLQSLHLFAVFIGHLRQLPETKKKTCFVRVVPLVGFGCDCLRMFAVFASQRSRWNIVCSSLVTGNVLLL